MIVQNLVTLLPPILIGVLITLLFFPGELFERFLLKLAIAPVTGIGVTSCLYYAWCLASTPRSRGFFLIEVLVITLLALALAARVWKARPALPHLKIKPVNWLSVALWLVFIGSLAAISVAFYRHSLVYPHGDFDAYSIWNLHARQIFIQDADWQQAFNTSINWKTHADYPLLLPLSVARQWAAVGQETPRTPALLAFIFTLSTPLILVLWLKTFKGNGVLAGLICLGTPFFFGRGVAQTADVPISLFFLLAGLFLWAYLAHGDRKYALLCTLFAGLAAWTKNEGALFLLLILLVMLVHGLVSKPAHNKLDWVYMAAGVCLPLIALLHFKLTIAVSNDLFAGRALTELLQSLLTWERYGVIFKSYWQNIITFGGMSLPILVLLGVQAVMPIPASSPGERKAVGYVAALIVLITAGNVAIFAITPHPLEWHLNYSVDRLLLQIYPLILFCVFVNRRNPLSMSRADFSPKPDSRPFVP